MNCTETRDWLDALIDGELDLGRSVEIERHLLDCPACASSRDAMIALRERIRAGAFAIARPMLLDRRVRRALSRERQERSRAWYGIPYLAVAASLVLAMWMWIPRDATSQEQFALNEVLAAHVRSTQVDHLVDVISSDQHTVKPWFEGKLDFAPPVRNYAIDGFVLVGGRMDYLAGANIAALIYQRNKHVINVFIRHERGPSERMRTETSQGYNIIRWRKGGMSFVAVSDLNANELHELAQLIATEP
jgi:anti-sigma factor RsiW